MWDRDDPDHLAGAAVNALSEQYEFSHFDAGKCLKWALDDATSLPRQPWDFNFGQPAITVVANADFRVDLLYWIENASAIHDHVTCGAFAVVHGERLHGTYQFVRQDEFGHGVEGGRLDRTLLENLSNGAVRPIRPTTIHDLFWLGKPSLTIVVRCAAHPGPVLSPRSYVGPGLSFVPRAHQGSSLVSRRIEGLQLLRQASLSMYAQSLRIALEGQDALMAVCAFTSAAVASPDVLDAVLDELKVSSPLMSSLEAARAGIVRRSYYGGMYVAEDEARLTVGLLWADADPAVSGAIIAGAFPTQDIYSVVAAGADAIERLAPDAAIPARALLRNPVCSPSSA